MRAMLTTPAAGGRYTIDERWGASGPGDRCLGADRRLRRTVLLWTADAPEDDPRRDALLTLARRGARLTHPAFLRVLDLVVAPDAVTVALEAPGGPRLAPDQFLRGGVPAGTVAAAVLSVGRALDDAARAGIAVSALPFTHLYWDEANGIRLDPIGVLDGRAESSPASGILVLLCGLLAALLPAGGRPLTGSTPPGDVALRSLLAQWQVQNDSDSPAALRRFLAELELLATPLPATAAGLGPVSASPAPADAPTRMLPRAGADAATQQSLAATLPAIASLRTAALPPLVQRTRRWSRSRLRAAVMAGAVLGVIVHGAATGWLPGVAGDEAGRGRSAGSAVPASKATLALTAQRDARIRITVDEGPVFSGVLRAGESRSWQGGSRVQVWTSDGKALLVTVNGFPLGVLSQAIGHPEWNTVDWGWPAGWTP